MTGSVTPQATDAEGEARIPARVGTDVEEEHLHFRRHSCML